MWTHTVEGGIPTRDLLLAVTEPDDTGHRFYIARVHHHHIDHHLVTDIGYLPLPESPRLLIDVDGSMWVDEHTIEIDVDGVSQVAS